MYTNLTNFSYGEAKRNQILKSFGISDDDMTLDDLSKAQHNSNLVLREVKPGVHRWVNPNGEEYAPEGRVVEFQHKGGLRLRGVVGKVHPKLGHYEIMSGDKKYEKLPHHITRVFDSSAPDAQKETNHLTPKISSNKGDTKIVLPEGVSISEYLKRRTTKELQGIVADPEMNEATKKVAYKVLELRPNVNLEDFKQYIGQGTKEPESERTAEANAAYHRDLKILNPDTGRLKGKWFHDINKRFMVYEDLADELVNGDEIRSLLIYGSGGVGKSYTINNTLKESGKIQFKHGMEKGSEGYDFVKLKGGKTTPASLYRTMYEHNGKLIILDDNDNLLRDHDGLNILKGATDTTDRRISWGSERPLKDADGEELPKSFRFNGKVMIISNLDTNNVALQPLKTRSAKLDMSMTPDQTIDRIDFIGKDEEGKYTKFDFKNEDGEDGAGFHYTDADARWALAFMRENKDEFGDDLSVRTVKTLITLRHRAERRGADPSEYAEAHLLSKALAASPEQIEQAFDNLIKGGIGSGKYEYKNTGFPKGFPKKKGDKVKFMHPGGGKIMLHGIYESQSDYNPEYHEVKGKNSNGEAHSYTVHHALFR